MVGKINGQFYFKKIKSCHLRNQQLFTKKMIESFKYYKKKDKPIDLSDVIDCSDKDNDKVNRDFWNQTKVHEIKKYMWKLPKKIIKNVKSYLEEV